MIAQQLAQDSPDKKRKSKFGELFGGGNKDRKNSNVSGNSSEKKVVSEKKVAKVKGVKKDNSKIPTLNKTTSAKSDKK